MNVFRKKLARMTKGISTSGTVAAQITSFVDVATKAFYFDERTFLQRDLLAAMQPTGDSRTTDMAYRTLVASGHILTSATGLAGKGESPYAFDLRPEPFRHVSNLEELIVAFERSSPSDRQVAATYQMLRLIGGLKSSTCRSMVLRESKLITERYFFSLPAALRLRCKAASLSKKTRQNMVSALKHLLAWGLSNDQFALWFPEYRPSDAWTALLDECFPVAGAGLTPRDVLHTRSGIYTMFRILRDEVGVASPSDLTARHIESGLQQVAVPHREVESLRVRRFPQADRRCPGNWEHPIVRLIVDTLVAQRHRPALPYLGSLEPHGESEYCLPGFIAIMRSHGLPSAWDEFFTWYWQYSSLSHWELRRMRDQFPPRGSIRQLREESFGGRLVAARAFLGIARELYTDRFLSLTPTQVFGELFESLSLEMMERWERRATAKHGPSHGASAGITHHVLAAGLIARALFDRSRHLRSRIRPGPSAKSDSVAHADGRGSLSEMPGLWLSGGLSAAEVTSLAAYEASRQDSSEMQRRRATSPQGTELNTVKDLGGLIRDTPFVHFQRAQIWMLNHVGELRAMGMEGTHHYGVWLMATIVNGLLISGGSRRSELGHLRDGIQTRLLSGNRAIALRSVDRKNRKIHKFLVRERWIPDDLLTSYRDVVRPRLLALAGLEEGANQFLILNPHTGRPYGCLEEVLEDGSGRNARSFSARRQQLSRLWRIHVAKAFVACNFFVPSGPQRFGTHIVRNVGGHAVYLKHGLEAAAAWLGDNVATVEGTYASLEGEQVDTSLVD